jgi:hypothetical protein
MDLGKDWADQGYLESKPDDLVKSILERHPGEPRIRSGAGAGVQNMLK